MTIEEALQLPVLSDAKVLTGSHTLANRPITWVSVIEVPVDEFIRPGEFVVSTGMNIGHDPALLTKFVRDVSRASPSALAIAVGPYTPAVSPRVIREAARGKLTLLEVPWKVRFSEISEAILRRLMREQISSRSLDDFVWSLATNSATVQDAAARGGQFGYDPRKRYVGVLGRLGRSASALSGTDDLSTVRFVRDVCANTATQSRTQWFGTAVGDSVTGYLEVAPAKIRARAWLGRVNSQLKGKCTVSWGIGRTCENFSDFQNSHQDAGIACDIGRATRGEGTITDISDVLGDRVLMKLKHDADAFMLTQRYVEPLRSAPRMQLVRTLETYFETDCNASETSRLLGISRQALLYRLNKAEALLDSDFESYEQRFAIALSLRLTKLNSA